MSTIEFFVTSLYHQLQTQHGAFAVSRRHTADDTIDFNPALRQSILELEEPGQVTQYLREYVGDERFARMHGILDKRTRRLTALMENVTNPHNTAACLRSCDAFGVQDLHIVTDNSQPIRVAKGIARKCHKWLTVHHHPTLETAISFVKAEGYRLAVTCPGGVDDIPVPLESVEMDEKLCVAFGNEARGASEQLRAAADFLMVIPMQGFVESLNISVAFALSMHWLRCRLDQERQGAGDLAELDRARIVDSWVFEQVPRAQDILMELARRKRAAESAP